VTRRRSSSRHSSCARCCEHPASRLRRPCKDARGSCAAEDVSVGRVRRQAVQACALGTQIWARPGLLSGWRHANSWNCLELFGTLGSRSGPRHGRWIGCHGVGTASSNSGAVSFGTFGINSVDASSVAVERQSHSDCEQLVGLGFRAQEAGACTSQDCIRSQVYRITHFPRPSCLVCSVLRLPGPAT
jgi:hypothetical protein